MPKNWTVNTKSAQAKAVKTAARNEEAERKQKALEDKMWEDNDKHVLKKQQRLEEKEKKDKERLEKKLEAKKLLDEEMSQLKSAKPEKASVAPSSSRMTQYEIDKIKERQEKAAAEAAQAALQGSYSLISLDNHLNIFYLIVAQKKLEVVEPELLENVNRIKIEGEVARNVEEAISILKYFLI